MNYDTTVIENIITGYLPHSIYAFETNTHPNYLKVGDTNRKVSVRLAEWKKVYQDLEQKFEAEAMIEDEQGEKTIFFRDYSLHEFLINDRHRQRLSNKQFEREFFQNATVRDVQEGIIDINSEYRKEGVGRYNYYQVGEENSSIEQHWSRNADYSPRPNQKQVIENIVKAVQEKNRKNLLLYAVMRFGKSNVAIWSAKRLNSKITVIVTGKADVKDEWKKTVESHIDFADFIFVTAAEFSQKLMDENPDKQFVVFATLQDLAGSREKVKDKHKFLFSSSVDFLVIDESHFGARAKIYSQAIEDSNKSDDNLDELGMNDKEFDEAIENVNNLNSKVKLHLSGTPYRILLSNEFEPDDIVGKVQFSDILTEKNKWIEDHTTNSDEMDADDKPWENPYFGFPQMVRFAFTPNKSSVEMLDELKEKGQSAELNELFAPDSTKKTKKLTCVFKHETDVLNLLKAMDGSSEDENIFPFLNYDKIRSGKLAQHMVLVLPFKNSCDAMARLLEKYQNDFNHLGDYQILNVAGNTSALGKPAVIQQQIKKFAADGQKTITLTVNKMLTGSTVPEWDTMIFLKDTKSPQDYDQAIFRLQSPWVKEIKDIYTGEISGKEDMKPQTLLIDFSPNRMFKIESDRAIVVNAADGRSGNDQQEIELKKNILVSPIIYLNRDKLKEATPSDIIAEIRKYSENTSIIDEVMEIPVDERLYNFPEIKAEIARQAELGSKAGLETQGYESNEEDNFNSPNTSNEDEQKNDEPNTSDSQGDIPTTDLPSPKQMQTYYSRILFYAFLSKNEEKNLSDIIENIESNDDNKRLARHLGLKKSILRIIKAHLNFGILSTLDNKIENIGDLRSDSSQQNILKGIKKFGRISPSEVFTPEWVAEMMVDSLVTSQFIEDYKENPVNIIDLTSKSGVYLIKMYQKLKEAGIAHHVLKEHLYAVATSDTGFEFTRAVYEDFDWNVEHLADVENLTSYNLIKNDSTLKTIQKEFGGNDLKFDVIIGNPPYQDATKKLLYPHFYVESKKIASNIALIFPTGWQDVKNNNGLEKLNVSEIKEDPQIIKIDNRHNVFPGITGVEWTNILVWKKGFDNGYDGKQLILTNGENPQVKKLLINKSEIEKPVEIVELADIVTKTSGFISIKSITTSRKPYGLATDAFKNYEKYGLSEIYEDKKLDSDIKLYKSTKKSVYVPKDYKFPRISKNFEKYKVLVPDAWGNLSKAGLGGAYADIIIAYPNEGTLGTFVESGGFDDYDTVKKHSKYLMTKFYRALLFANKHSIINSTALGAVPLQDYSESFWNKSIDDIDDALFVKYELPQNIINFIKNNIQTKSEKNIINYF